MLRGTERRRRALHRYPQGRLTESPAHSPVTRFTDFPFLSNSGGLRVALFIEATWPQPGADAVPGWGLVVLQGQVIATRKI
jgi:hypothetical protein